MKHVVLGTAGHIDHGKTALVRALTGTDPDRLPEERARGITIDLGFASFAPSPELRIGVVDVPGHERFVKNMVAGTGGLDLVALVIAADEGVMPQTREHLDICRLLGIPKGVVVLSKLDLVDADWLALVRDDVRAFLRGSFLEDAALCEVSTVDGRGLDDLRATLAALGRDSPARAEGGLPRLPVDRVFTLAGFGTVVTGSLVAGRLRVGDLAEALPSGARAKIRRLHAYGEEVAEARAGMRTAVNLQGLERSAIERGDVLCLEGALLTTERFDADVTLLPIARRALEDRARLLCHLGTAQAMATVVLLDRARLEPGETAAAQLRLDRALVTMPGDRFILRGFEALAHHGRTVGGGLVLDAHPPAWTRKARPGAARELASLRTGAVTDRIETLLRRASTAGLETADLARRLTVSTKELERALGELLSRHRVLRFERERGGTIHADVAEALRDALVARVRAYHEAHPEEGGMPREALRVGLDPKLDPRLFALILERASNDAVADEARVRPAGAERVQPSASSGLEGAAHRRLLAAGLAPPSPKELAGELGVDEGALAKALGLLVTAGEVVRLRGELYFARAPIDALRALVVSHLLSHGELDTQTFKELTGLSRKYVIPLQEHLDAEKLTLRVGDKRVLRARPSA